MDAYNDSEPSCLALARRRAERSAPSSSAGDLESCCPKESFAARHARAPSAKHTTAGAANSRALGTHRVLCALCGLFDPALEVFLDELGGEHDLGIVLGGVLDLLKVVQPAVLV